MNASNLLPYLVVAGFPILLLVLYALFRWRYLRSVGQHLYTRAGVTRAVTEAVSPPVRDEQSKATRQIEITWADAADVVTWPQPPSLVEAYRRTRAMRGVFAVSGAVFTFCSGVTIWYALITHGWQPRSAWVIGSLNTLSGLFVTLAFARLGWSRSIGAVLAWIGLQFALLLGAVKMPLPAATSLIFYSISLTGIPIVGAGLMALRTTRILTVAFMPAMALLIVLTTAVGVTLEALGIRVEGTPSVSATALGAANLVIGVVVVVRQIRRGLERRFVAMWLSATCAFSLMAWLTGHDVWMVPVGIGVNGSFVLLWWGVFTRFLRLRADGHMPDEILHFSGCLAVLAVWIGVLTGVTRFEVLWPLIPFVAYAITLWMLLRRRRTSTSVLAPRLLLLRVFHQSPRDTWLIDTLDDSWRRAGRLDLMVGLDLALRAVNTLALENFFLGRVHRHFVRSLTDVRERLSRLPRAMALDGRYPLNELHCLLDTWEWVVEALVREARVVVMDLRGLSASNTGALQELAIVIPRVALSQVVILSDRSTDERLLAEGIRDAWSRVPPDSPNFHRPSGTLRLLRCCGSRRIDAHAVDWAVFTAASGEQAVRHAL